MRVEIDENGLMVISSESKLEAFALKKWWEKSTHEISSDVTAIETRHIMIHTGIFPPAKPVE